MLHILHADNNDTERELFKHILKRFDSTVKVTEASNIKQVVEVLDHAFILPDLIFMDYVMYPLDGVACTKQIRNSNKFCHLPVVMYANAMSSEQLEAAYAGGSSYYLQKPDDVSELEIILPWLVKQLPFNHRAPVFDNFVLTARRILNPQDSIHEIYQRNSCFKAIVGND